jgi:uncharacterized membrane protein
MNWLIPVRIVATVSTGLAAGVFLGHAMGVSIAAPELEPSGFVQLQQIIHVNFVPMMPILLFAAAGATTLLAIGLRAQWRAPAFWLALLAAIGMIVALVLTLKVNVPINEQLMTWHMEAPPADLRERWRPWQASHTIRTVVSMIAFALLASVPGTPGASAGGPAARPAARNGRGDPDLLP